MPLGVLVHVVEPRRAGAPGLAHRCAQGRQRGQLCFALNSFQKRDAQRMSQSTHSKEKPGKEREGWAACGRALARGERKLVTKLGAEVTEK